MGAGMRSKIRRACHDPEWATSQTGECASALRVSARGPRRAAGSPWQAPVQTLSNQGFDHCLATDVQTGRFLIKLFKHFGGEVDIHPLNGIQHSSTSEKPADILAP